MKFLIAAVLSVVAFNSYGQQGTTLSYPLEFEWQNELAQKESKNIQDYFLLLPSVLIDCEGAQYGAYSTTAKREKIIKVLDIKNGYVQFHNTAQLVLFKDRKNNKDILAIQVGGCGAANTCGAHNTLLELNNNMWSFRVDLLPKGKMIAELYYVDPVCPYFDLPRYDTTILIKDENDNNSIVTKYKWDGHRFYN